jgi:hypothetical protein
MAKEAFDDLHSRFEMAINAIENEKAGNIPAKPHTDLDRAVVRFDPGYQMRHYIDSSCSLLSEAISYPAPSMQVSSHLDSTMDTSDSFVTARMELEQTEYPHIVVDGLPDIAASFLLPFYGTHIVKDIQIMIASKIALPESSLRISYGDTILNDPEATLDSLNITHGTTLSCHLLEAEALSPDTSHGLESSDNAVSEHRVILRAEEAPGSGDDSWSTHLSTHAAESQRELKVYTFLRPTFGSRRIRRIEQILVLDLSRHTVQVCRIEDIEGTLRPYDSRSEQILTSEQGRQIYNLWHIRLPPPKIYADIIHLSMRKNFTSNEYQPKAFVIASKGRFQSAPYPSYVLFCTLRLDTLRLSMRMLRILGRLNELYIIRSQPLSDDSEQHDFSNTCPI